MTKNVIILKDIVKYNTMKIHKKGIVRVPDYIVNHCVMNNKDLIITHKGVVLKRIKSTDVILDIVLVESKEFEGKFLDEDIVFKLAVFNVSSNKED